MHMRGEAKHFSFISGMEVLIIGDGKLEKGWVDAEEVLEL